MTDSLTEDIGTCIDEWNVAIDSQLHQMGEEIGEIHEAINTQDDLGEELGDGMFVLRSIAYLQGESITVPPTDKFSSMETDRLIFQLNGKLCKLEERVDAGKETWAVLGAMAGMLQSIADREDINLERWTEHVTRENLEKDTEKEGNKVTKE